MSLAGGCDRQGRPVVILRLGGLRDTFVETCGKKALIRQGWRFWDGGGGGMSANGERAVCPFGMTGVSIESHALLQLATASWL